MSQPQSRSASAAPQHEAPPAQSPRRNGRGRSRTPRSSSASSDDSGPSTGQPNNRRRRRNKGGALPDLDETEDTGRAVTGTASNTVNKGGSQGGEVDKDDGGGGGGGGGDKPLKLRLDLNLDVEVELKARVHGDLTLALL